jgi:hypothetical protein
VSVPFADLTSIRNSFNCRAETALGESAKNRPQFQGSLRDDE